MKIKYGNIAESRADIINYIVEQKQLNNSFRVIDIGGSADGWSSNVCDLIVDFVPSKDLSKFINMDICRETEWQKLLNIVNIDGKFDYAICTHTLEDVYNPFTALEYLPKIAHQGIITMPSIYQELSRCENVNWLGYIHHRYIFDKTENGEMIVIPKLNFLESIVKSSVSTYNRTEVIYEWNNTIPYKIFMNNWLGPNVDTVIKEYQNFIDKTFQLIL